MSGRSAEGSGPWVDEIFDAVVDLDAARREAELAARCAGHPSVEQQVRAMLAVAPRLEPQPGARVAGFELVERLGEGATSSVWRAFDPQLQAWTALKVLRPRHGDALEAVLREARAASAIISDHVVRIRAVGRTDDDVSYIEMQLCAEHRAAPEGKERLVVGRSLADDPPVDVREAVRCVAEACAGVEAGHRVGVLHRDVKPANILLTPVSRRVLVTDFGLAAAPSLYAIPGPGTSAQATVSVQLDGPEGVLVGTPPYMAPELLLGARPSRAVDVYALGATLWALLAGRPPYQATGRLSPIAALDVLEQVRRGPPPDLESIERPTSLPVARVPARLARVVRKAMHRDPSQRYATAAELGGDLERWLADRPTSIDGRAPLVRAWLLARRNRELVAAGVVLAGMLALSAGAVAALEQRRRALEADVAAAEERRTEAQAAAREAERVQELAVLEKEAAVADAIAAMEARNLAQEDQTAAERRAAEEIVARRAADLARDDAERQRQLAEARRDAAEQALRRELLTRAEAEEALEEALGAARTEQERARALEAALAASEARVEQLARDLEDVLAEIASLRELPEPEPEPEPEPTPAEPGVSPTP